MEVVVVVVDVDLFFNEDFCFCCDVMEELLEDEVVWVLIDNLGLIIAVVALAKVVVVEFVAVVFESAFADVVVVACKAFASNDFILEDATLKGGVLTYLLNYL